MPAPWGWSAQYSYPAPSDPVAAPSKREVEIERATTATEAWTGLWPTGEVFQYIESFVDQALEAPAVTIRWLAPKTRSAELIRPFRNVAIPSRCMAFVHPITDDLTLAGAEHELGHNRTKHVYGTLAREHAAWEWARAHSPVWTDPMQATMVFSLRTYLTDATVKDIVDVQKIDHLCSPLEYRKEKQRRLNLELERERHNFLLGRKR
jgi:hypothetical protein